MIMMRYQKKTRPAPWTLVHPKRPEPKQFKPIPRMSKAKKREHRKYLQQRRVFLEKNPRCAVDKQHTSCDVHHMRGRAGSLYLDERFWLPVCRGCHDWIHKHMDEARQKGFLCQTGEWNVPVRPTSPDCVTSNVM